MRGKLTWAAPCLALLLWSGAPSVAAAAPPEIILAGNLNGAAAVGDAIEVNVELRDGAGSPYPLTLRFLSFGPGSWVWDASSSDPRVLNPSPLGSGIAFFDDDGLLIAGTGPEGWIDVQLQNGLSFQGSSAVTVELDALTDRVGTMTAHQVTTAPRTATRTPSPTRTRTATRTRMSTRTATLSRTPTSTRTATRSRTPTMTRTVANSRTPMPTRTRSVTRTPTPTQTRTRTPHPVVDELVLSGNLNSNTDETTIVERGAGFVDSLGQPHNLTLRFEKRPFSNAWDWEISTFDATILDPSPLAAGRIGFGDNGLASVVPGQPEGLLRLTFSNGARSTTGGEAIRVEMDDLTGHSSTTTLRTNAPPRPTAVATRTPRVPTPTRTLTPIRTRRPTAAPTEPNTPTVTPIDRRGTLSTVQWLNSPLIVELASGNTIVETVTFSVARPLVGARAVVVSRGGSVAIDPIPTELEAGVDYPITLRMSVGRPGQRLVGSVQILDRSKSSLGPTGKFVVAIKASPATPTRTVMPGLSPTRIGSPTRPRPSVVVQPRINWLPSQVNEFLAPGDTVQVEVALESTGLVARPSFHFFGRSGIAQIDPASLPARLEPGVPHTLKLSLTLPADRVGRSESLSLAVRSTGGTLEGQLILRLTPRR